MENKNILNIVIVLTVGIVLTGSLLVPVIDDYSSTYKEVKNNASGYMANAMNDSGTLVVDTTSGSTVLTWDGEDLDINNGTYAISDKFVVYGTNGTTKYADPNGYVSNISPETTITVTFTDGNATVVYGEVEATYTLNWAFVRTGSDGDYIMYSPGATTFTHYLNSMDQIWGSNWIDTTSEWFSYHGAEVTVGDETITADYTLNKVDGYTNLYTLKIGGSSDSEYSFTVDNDGTDYEVHPRFAVVPAEITAIKEDGAGILSLLSTIPVLIIVALVMLVVGAIYVKGRD